LLRTVGKPPATKLNKLVSPISHSDSHVLFPNWQPMGKMISPASACGFLRLDRTGSAHTHGERHLSQQ